MLVETVACNLRPYRRVTGTKCALRTTVAH